MNITIKLSQAEVSGIASYLAEVNGGSVTAVNVESIAEEAKNRLYQALRDPREAISDHVLSQEKSHSPFDPDCKPVSRIGELRRILNTFDENDIVVLENEDLYPFYVDVIDGIDSPNGVVREIRLTLIEN